MSKENGNLNEAESSALNIADVIRRAYKAGYEQRVIDQLQAALDGESLGSHYNSEKLDKHTERYVSKHCV